MSSNLISLLKAKSFAKGDLFSRAARKIKRQQETIEKLREVVKKLLDNESNKS